MGKVNVRYTAGQSLCKGQVHSPSIFFSKLLTQNDKAPIFKNRELISNGRRYELEYSYLKKALAGEQAFQPSV